MDEQGNNDRPPVPDGVGSNETSIVPVRPQGRRAPARASLGLMWCAIGALLCTTMVPLGCVLVAAGMAVLASAASEKKWVGYAAVLLVPVVGGVLGGYPSDIARNAVSYLAACAVGSSVSKRGTFLSREILVAALLAAALFAVDYVTAKIAGFSLTDIVAKTFDAMVKEYEQRAGLEVMSQLKAAKDMFLLLWPSCYALMAAVLVWLSHVGARAGLSRTAPRDLPKVPLREFDTPLWVVALFVVGIVVLAAGNIASPWSHQITMVGANLLMACRIVFAIQGLAIGTWLCDKFRMGIFLRAFLFVILVDLEFSLMAASVVGLVDVWANFRRLPRGNVRSVEEETV